MKFMKILLNLLLTFVMFITMACEDEKVETLPESATISGTITFSGDWPSTGQRPDRLRTVTSGDPG